MIKNANALPAVVVPILEQHVGILQSVLGERLVGVYVHGSGAMGGFNPSHSDLDYIALVASSLTPDERRALAEAFLPIVESSGFKKGIEMSIVEARYAGSEFVYPTPFEFHFGGEEYVIHSGKIPDKPKSDPDLASYFAVIYERGVAVYGKEIREVFAPIPRVYYWKSVAHDIKDARDGIRIDPVYHILNLCRTYYGLRDDAIYSKLEGAEKYLADSEMSDKEIVKTALDAYQSGATLTYDAEKLTACALRLLQEITPRLEHATR